MPQTQVGIVSSIRRYPVKSMLGEELDEVSVTAGGVIGDRAFALIDDETGKVISVKRRGVGCAFSSSPPQHVQPAFV